MLITPTEWSGDEYVARKTRVVQQYKAMHLSARGVTTVPGLNPGCITSGRDWESHRATHNWPSIIQVWPG